jgi:hypothetical protein
MKTNLIFYSFIFFTFIFIGCSKDISNSNSNISNYNDVAKVLGINSRADIEIVQYLKKSNLNSKSFSQQTFIKSTLELKNTEIKFNNLTPSEFGKRRNLYYSEMFEESFTESIKLSNSIELQINSNDLKFRQSYKIPKEFGFKQELLSDRIEFTHNNDDFGNNLFVVDFRAISDTLEKVEKGKKFYKSFFFNNTSRKNHVLRNDIKEIESVSNRIRLTGLQGKVFHDTIQGKVIRYIFIADVGDILYL